MSLPIDGNVQTTQGIIYAGPPQGLIGRVLNMKFTNSLFVSWTISVWQFIPGSAAPKLLYKVNLDAGDNLIDSNDYKLPAGSSIQAAASSTSVNFVINGIEE